MTTQSTKKDMGRGIIAISILIIAAVTIAVWVPFIGAAEVENMVDLNGTSWKLAAMDGEAVFPDSEITARFEEGRFGGSAGVNNYFVSYELDEDKLSLGPAGSTMMMGPEDMMDQEMTFLSALQTVESFQVDGDTLELIYEGGIFVFTPFK